VLVAYKTKQQNQRDQSSPDLVLSNLLRYIGIYLQLSAGCSHLPGYTLGPFLVVELDPFPFISFGLFGLFEFASFSVNAI
jgi:hypothetical protein